MSRQQRARALAAAEKRRSRASKKTPWKGAVVSFAALENNQVGSRVSKVYLADGPSLHEQGVVSGSDYAALRSAGTVLVAKADCSSDYVVCYGDVAIEALAEFLANSVGKTLTKKA